MFFSPEIEESIKSIVRRMLDGVLKKRLNSEPWDIEDEKKKRPFHYAIAPEIVWKAAKFERSLVTIMGQIGWEQIARLVAENFHGHAVNGKSITGKTYEDRIAQIHTIIDQLERESTPNWDKELNEILSIETGNIVSAHVTADLYVLNTKKNIHYYFEIKSSKPNSDQTKVSKEKLLKIKAMYPGDNHQVYYALPFNPYGERENYAHPHPKRWFDMINDEAVLMGKEFWDIVGGEGAYEAVIEIFKEVGKEYIKLIKKDYFQLDD